MNQNGGLWRFQKVAVTRTLKRATSRVKRFEKFSLNFWVSLLVMRVNLLHPCFFMVYYYLFGIFQVLFSGFLQFKDNFVDGQNNSNYSDSAPLIFDSIFRHRHCIIKLRFLLIEAQLYHQQQQHWFIQGEKFIYIFLLACNSCKVTADRR